MLVYAANRSGKDVCFLLFESTTPELTPLELILKAQPGCIPCLLLQSEPPRRAFCRKDRPSPRLQIGQTLFKMAPLRSSTHRLFPPAMTYLSLARPYGGRTTSFVIVMMTAAVRRPGGWPEMESSNVSPWPIHAKTTSPSACATHFHWTCRMPAKPAGQAGSRLLAPLSRRGEYYRLLASGRSMIA